MRKLVWVIAAMGPAALAPCAGAGEASRLLLLAATGHPAATTNAAADILLSQVAPGAGAPAAEFGRNLADRCGRLSHLLRRAAGGEEEGAERGRAAEAVLAQVLTGSANWAGGSGLR